MSSSALSQPVSQPDEASRLPTNNRHPVVPAALSACLLWATFPPLRWNWFAWVALVPLFLLIRSARRPASVYFGSWVGGMVFWTLAIQWVRLSDESAWLGWLTMALVLSFYWPVFLWLARLAVNRLKVPLMLAAPIVWVGLEYSRAYFLTGFPWYYLAHGQSELLPLIQIADFSGALGVSFLIALLNAWVVDLLTLPLLRVAPTGARLTPPQLLRLTVVGSLLGLTFLYGTYRLTSARFRDGPRVALLQTSLVQRLRDGKDPEELFHVYERLIVRAIQEDPRPDLILWPETAYPWGMVSFGSGMDDATIAQQLKDHRIKLSVKDRKEQRELILRQLHSLTDVIKTPMAQSHRLHQVQLRGPLSAWLERPPDLR
jgi:apolipoprotein N-acyltransferase